MFLSQVLQGVSAQKVSSSQCSEFQQGSLQDVGVVAESAAEECPGLEPSASAKSGIFLNSYKLGC